MEILITGGAGFIGANAAAHFLQSNQRVTLFDNFSRPGSRANLKWLLTLKGKLKVIEGDVRRWKTVQKAINKSDVVIHLAAQVAVTTSVNDPKSDLETNLWGTFNVLESARQLKRPPLIIYASSNKVYGEMINTLVVEHKTRYDYKKLRGVDESQPLDFHSPYGCSKGAADQYVHDYHRIYGLPTIVFRQSCIYGPRQFGIEDQGWLAWFMIAITKGHKITIYGDGKQVRDILYVSDLVNAYERAIACNKTSVGKIYNIGGGRQNSISIWTEFHGYLENLFAKKITVAKADWRPGDQKVYISNIDKIRQELGWSPKVSVTDGLKSLFDWTQQNKSILK